MAYCEHAASTLFDATETHPGIVEYIVLKQLCASLVSTAAAMAEHSCSVAISLLRVCCKSIRSRPHEASQQLQSSTTILRLTAVLKNSSMKHELDTRAADSLLMYSSMILVSMAAELGDAILQVRHLGALLVAPTASSHMFSQPLLIHNTLQHICASISSKSFMNWTLPDRIGSSHALLALCREPRTWLQLAEAGVERAILQMMLDVDLEVLWHAVEKCFSVLDLQLLTALVQMRTNAIHMVIAVAQLGPSQLRHMVKHVHGSVCQMVYNCMNGAFAHLQNLAQDSEDFAELTLVSLKPKALNPSNSNARRTGFKLAFVIQLFRS